MKMVVAAGEGARHFGTEDRYLEQRFSGRLPLRHLSMAAVSKRRATVTNCKVS